MKLVKLLRFLPLLVFSVISGNYVYAQNPPYIPSVVPPSPNAASLMKFTDVPVSPYNGTADVTIPIYTIDAKGIKVPISLGYHTGGIRLKEEAGWVGLGWALNAGGMISRTINDKDDFSGQVYFNALGCPDLLGNPVYPPTYGVPGYNSLGAYCYNFYCNYNIYMDQGTLNMSQPMEALTSYDLSPDSYSYNFLGRSGKFIINREGKVIQQKQDNLKLRFETNGNSFTITDEEGNNYRFADKEYTSTTSTGPMAISSWMLSSIITQQGDTVKFNYYTDNSYTYVQGDIFEVFRYACSSSNGYAGGTYVPAVYLNNTLQSIDFRNGQVQFGFDGNRNDLQNGKKLDSIGIYSKNAAGALQYVKSHQFSYSYFNAGQNYGTNLEFQRLRLDSIKEISGTRTIPPYSFIYDTIANYQYIQASAKHNWAVDHWGFFNGITGSGNSQYTPGYSGYFQLQDPPQNVYENFPGANRNPDSISMQEFALQQVNYPTGGSTVLQYQPNYYNDTKSSLTGLPDFPVLNLTNIALPKYSYNTGTVIDSIDLTNFFGSAIIISITFRNPQDYRNTTGKIYAQFAGFYEDIGSSNLDCSSNSVCTLSQYSLPATPGKYALTMYIDPSVNTNDFAGIYVTINFQELTSVANGNTQNPTFMAGGLAIKSITDYSAPGIVAKQRVYNYHTADQSVNGYTYGRLMSHPTYIYNETINSSDGAGNRASCESITRGSGSNTSLSSNIQGNIVGYDTVEEYTVDPATSKDIGKTVYTYYNVTDSLLNYGGFRVPGVSNVGNSLSGLLLSKIEYINGPQGYTIVSQTDNRYHTTNRQMYWALKVAPPLSLPGGGGCPNGQNIPFQDIACLSPVGKSERVLQDYTRETLYDQQNLSGTIITQHNNYYDNPVHYQLTRSSTTDSKGNILTTSYKYPQDYIPNGNTVTGNTILDSMIGRNIVGPTIEKTDSLYYAGSGTGYVTGASVNLFRSIPTAGNALLPDKVYNLDLPSPVTNFQPFAISGNTTSLDSRYRQMISMDSYDNLGDIQQYTPTDQLPVSFIWDYKHVYPVAQVKNAAVTDIAFTSFEADGTGNWTYTGTATPDATAPTGSYSYNLAQPSGGVSKTGLTSATTYIVSYWSKTGSNYTVTGSTSVTQGKTIGLWTYFEHTVTGSTSVSVSGTGYIDELRLYPQAGQMTSYTYSPLVGTTSVCDVDNRISYYFYDGLGRLVYLKDQDGNIIKTYQYHYQGQP